jgi:cytochrome c-type biogenesis protein CcmH/NrfG
MSMLRPSGPSSRVRSAMIAGACIAATACASVPMNAVAPSAAEIPDLEVAVRREPGDAGLLVRLGAAYRAAGRLEDARITLERSVALNPADGGGALFLGLTYEDLEMPAAA